jgi:hypothetical protein
MADELESTAPPPPEGEAAPAGPSGRERELERELGQYRERNAALEATLRVLGPTQRAPAEGPVPIVRLSREQAQRVAGSLGGEWTEDAVQQHAPIFAAFLQELAGPILVGLEGMADVVDLVQTRQEVTDYPTVAEEAEAVRREYRSRGQTITRKQAVALVKSRRMDDPNYMDRLVDERAKTRAETRERQAAQAAAAATEGGAPSPQKAGPEPTKGPRAPVSKAEFDRLPLEEKRRALQDAVI